MDTIKSSHNGTGKGKKLTHNDTIRRSERSRRASSHAESELKITTTVESGSSGSRGIKSFLCCGSRAEDVYEQAMKEHKRPGEIPLVDTGSNAISDQKSPTVKLPTTAHNITSAGSSAPQTLYSQLPSGYVSRTSIESNSTRDAGKIAGVSGPPAQTADTTASSLTSSRGNSVRRNGPPTQTLSKPHEREKVIREDISEIDTSGNSDKTPKDPPHSMQAKAPKNFSERSSAPSNSVKGHHRPHTNTDLSQAAAGRLTVAVPPNGHNYSSSHGSAPSLSPVAAASHSSNIFPDMNHMESVAGVKLDRALPTSGENIAMLGDAHLSTLEQSCIAILDKMSIEKAELRRQVYSGGDTLPILPSPSSANFTEVSLAFTEVLQMQNRPKEALQVLSRAIEELNTDLTHAKKYRNGTLSSANSASSSPPHSSGQIVEFDYLKKMKALCHRRIGSLYKLTSRYADAEEHVRKYIGMMERHESSVAARREVATAYSLLASIYDSMGRGEDAQTADMKALELAAS